MFIKRHARMLLHQLSIVSMNERRFSCVFYLFEKNEMTPITVFICSTVKKYVQKYLNFAFSISTFSIYFHCFLVWFLFFIHFKFYLSTLEKAMLKMFGGNR